MVNNPDLILQKPSDQESGLYLTDLTFCREGNPSTRPSPTAPEKKLINFNKYHKLARIVQGMFIRFKPRVFGSPPRQICNGSRFHITSRRFQRSMTTSSLPWRNRRNRAIYKISTGEGEHITALTRTNANALPHSLLIEPRQPADTPPASDVRQLFSWATRQPSALTPTTA